RDLPVGGERLRPLESRVAFRHVRGAGPRLERTAHRGNGRRLQRSHQAVLSLLRSRGGVGSCRRRAGRGRRRGRPQRRRSLGAPWGQSGVGRHAGKRWSRSACSGGGGGGGGGGGRRGVPARSGWLPLWRL